MLKKVGSGKLVRADTIDCQHTLDRQSYQRHAMSKYPTVNETTAPARFDSITSSLCIHSHLPTIPFYSIPPPTPTSRLTPNTITIPPSTHHTSLLNSPHHALRLLTLPLPQLHPSTKETTPWNHIVRLPSESFKEERGEDDAGVNESVDACGESPS